MNEEKAVELFRRSEATGAISATFNMGIMYEQGRGVGQDLSKAAEQYRRAVDGGHVKAITNLSVCFRVWSRPMQRPMASRAELETSFTI